MSSTIETINEYAFSHCAMTNLTIINYCTTISNNAFANSNLRNITFPDSLVSIGSLVFVGCPCENITFYSKFKIINKNALTNSSVKYLYLHSIELIEEEAFYNSSIHVVQFPESANLSIKRYAFSYCDIDEIILPHGTENIARFAFRETQMNTLSIPSTLKNIVNWTFAGCQVKNLIIREGITEIPEFYFSLNDFVHVTLPSTLKSIGRYAFMWSWMNEISIPAGCNVSNNAFKNCEKLKNITIGANCIINKDAFILCNNTENIIVSENITYTDMVFLGMKNVSLTYTGVQDVTDTNATLNYQQIATNVNVPQNYENDTFCTIPITKKD
ncbi:surface antigen BspA-like [Trichomonas vaginalis G3]|uniref:Surface antigen BspA-like n=1 Tax=Trichomonas vaginalis (strain ATCC PRA-98 / G3) TaxID=412133 RepID=A2EAU7_TRIV3|nr:leucine-rich repeats (6 copies)-containing protein [Trichomonas vaginalis G3]EAY10192.1 surface antigen BspA-like [Trichomonas vaginalis G3]KAI5513617.1 leucine-rich repeats (6 copies)-containing protein [Trichomonas vaginalis G3]|eukprot:XP_001322415.1 surface antigen BspA-like [Trichomonas vaginalis G3]